MKTTIDIPEPLYKKAKIRAVEKGQTLKQLVVDALQREFASPSQAGNGSFLERRKLRPEFRRLLESAELGGGTDSTVMISEDRSSREDALL